MSTHLQVPNGPRWPVDPLFVPLAGFDEHGQPQSLPVGSGGLKVEAIPSPLDGQVFTAGGVTTRSRTVWKRPNDTTGYLVNDVVGTNPASIRVLPNVARVAGGSGLLLSVRLTAASLDTVGQSFDVWLYQTPPTPVADNAIFPLLFADDAHLLGRLTLTLATGGVGSDCATAVLTGANLPYQTAPGDRDLYAVVVTRNSWTPSGDTDFSLEVGVAND